MQQWLARAAAAHAGTGTRSGEGAPRLTKVVKQALLVQGERGGHAQVALQVLAQHVDQQELVRLAGHLLRQQEQGPAGDQAAGVLSSHGEQADDGLSKYCLGRTQRPCSPG